MENITLDKALKIAEQFMNENTIGVEIECIANRQRGRHLARDIAETTGINCTYEGYTHRLTGAWKIVTDGSLSNWGIEIVSPPLKPVQLFKVMAVLLPYLESVVLTVNRSCSAHMHYYAKRLNNYPKRLQYFLNHGVKNENICHMLAAEPRRSSLLHLSNH